MRKRVEQVAVQGVGAQGDGATRTSTDEHGRARTGEVVPAVVEEREDPAPGEVSIGTVEGKHRMVSILMPLEEAPVAGYCARHIQVQLNPKQAATMRQLRDLLSARGEKTTGAWAKKEKAVKSEADVVRWLMDVLGQ